MTRFSAIICVYKGDNPIYFKESLLSISNQVFLPSEVIIVADGPIPNALKFEIKKFTILCEKKRIPIKVFFRKKNYGHGLSRSFALSKTNYDLVVFNDADDVSLPMRYKLQVLAFNSDPDLSVLGTAISEIDDNNKIIGTKICPRSHDVSSYICNRCPVNQNTVMFRKSAVLMVGGYIDFYHNEDYFLWIRLFISNFKIDNLPNILVIARVDDNFYKRRGGVKYFISESKIQIYLNSLRLISRIKMMRNIILRFIIQVAAPHFARKFIYKNFLRNSL